MIINTTFLKSQLSMRKNNLEKSKPIGSAIKFRRKEANMTLEEASDGICSISYLSKLENNRINPTDKFLYPILDRFGLKQIEEVSDDNEIYEIVINHFITGIHLNDDFIIQYKNRDDHQSKIIMTANYILNEEYDLAYNTYTDLKKYIKFLNDNEVTVLLYLLAKISYHVEDYYDSYKILKMIDIKISEKMSILMNYLIIMNAFKMHKIADITNKYQLLTEELLNYQLYGLLNNLKVSYLTFFSKYQAINETEEDIERLINIPQINKDYILSLSYFSHSKFDKALKLSEKYYNTDKEFYLLHLRILNTLNESDKIIRIIRTTSYPFSETKNLYIHILLLKHTDDNYALVRYLRDKLFDSLFRIDDSDSLFLILEEAKAAFRKSFFYKEALLVDQKIMPRLKNLLISL